MRIILDIGNTRIKIAVYQKNTCLKTFSLPKNEFENYFQQLIEQNKNIDCIIVSSVGDITKKQLESICKSIPLYFVNKELNFPFINTYQTPDTLGADRMVLASGAIFFHPNTHCLVIDVGSCITYDFITSEKKYLGGAISPGIRLRYQSMHDFTAQLPLINHNQNSENNLIGTSTNTSMQSGVINGVAYEIDGFIDAYKELYDNLTVILTGGDAKYLSEKLKNRIFVHSNYLIESLNALYEYNL